jgi:hypothetical protein
MTITWADVLWWLWATVRFAFAPPLRLALFVVQIAMLLAAWGFLFNLLAGSTDAIGDVALGFCCAAVGMAAREARWRL